MLTKLTISAMILTLKEWNSAMNNRLKQARKYLNLSQEFVARQMNLSRPTISAIESGQRKVSAEELDRFSKLYGVSTEELMHGKVSDTVEAEMFARAFSELSDKDKKEIMNLIDFKRRYKEHIDE